ncbi:ABC transporter substrate-binding protein [Dysgonomonas sp. ZJ709]|uniref:ABC transporter substrate-binding protein n=1 Tax=Dysgonomonas sp. ZJ709 TaxID=2709797 RepID=UPI0013EB9BB6|nr:ABC transporter substrate-binding protein [Dysgonomonas sp. ZJ709]
MRIFIILFSFAFLVGCGNSNTLDKKQDNLSTISVTDIQGNEIHLSKAAERIICLFDPSVDVIYMLQAQDKLIGIPAETYFDNELYDYYKHIDTRILKKELPTPGSNELANLESIIQLNPDLVIAQQLPESIVKTLQGMNIPVYIAAAARYEDLMKEMKDISLLTGKQDRGEQLISYAENKIKDLQKRTATQEGSKHKSVYFTWANGKVFSTAGRNSMMNDCLDLAGVENACPFDIDKPNINPETLIEWNPDMIVMWNDSPDLFYNKKELGGITAIKERKIHNLMPMFYYNPHTFKSLCAAVAINQWAYDNDEKDNTEEIKEILSVLYGKEASEKLIKYL